MEVSEQQIRELAYQRELERLERERIANIQPNERGEIIDVDERVENK